MQYRIVIIHAELVVEVQQLLHHHHHLHPHSNRRCHFGLEAS